tara:strand:- start:595 stop:960 length:366 start_codon:yes stop_codon:yes gene_type:complete
MLKQMMEEIKKNEENTKKLYEIIDLIGGECSLDNVVSRVGDLINEKPLNPSMFKSQLQELENSIDEIESDYDNKYSEIESAFSSLEYISSELDYICDAKDTARKLRQSVEDAEMDSLTDES